MCITFTFELIVVIKRKKTIKNIVLFNIKMFFYNMVLIIISYCEINHFSRVSLGIKT